MGIELPAEKGLADSGDLDNDLSELLTEVGKAARQRNTAVVLYIDELQYVAEDQLASLISALHNAEVGQAQLRWERSDRAAIRVRVTFELNGPPHPTLSPAGRGSPALRQEAV